MEIYKKLINIQQNLKAPKNQYNAFGKYNYRNCEDILEALKPILNQYGTTIIISDKIIKMDERFYVESTIKFIDAETGESIETTALAREEETKKGQDGSQVTGSSSSYARKYALNGLFLIDDTKDSDTTNKESKEKSESLLSDAQIKRVYAIAKSSSLTEDAVKKWIQGKFGKESLKDLNKSEYDSLCEALERAKHVEA